MNCFVGVLVEEWGDFVLGFMVFVCDVDGGDVGVCEYFIDFGWWYLLVVEL